MPRCQCNYAAKTSRCADTALFQHIIIASENGCETLVCNLGAPVSMSLLPSAEGLVACCWSDGLVAVYKRTQLFAVPVWTVQLAHRVTCMCTHVSAGAILAASVSGSCSAISAADGRIVRTFSLGPVVVMALFVAGDSSFLCITRDGCIMLFSLEGSAARRAFLSLGCPLLHAAAASDCMLSVVKSNGCVQLVECFPDDCVIWDRGSVVCLKTATMSALAGAPLCFLFAFPR